MTLPPLPHTGDDAAHDPGGRSIVDVLTEEHERITALCRELAGGTVSSTGAPHRRRDLVEVLTATLSRHLSAEEQYLYPSVRAALGDGDQLAEREVAADVELLTALRVLEGAADDDPRFAELTGAVAAGLDRHVRAADGTLFPRLREVSTMEDLIRLGNRVEIAEEAAPTRPHPGAPHTPPWNKVVEPALGVVDKVRDAAGGRTTYPEDLT
ncbi:hemerythrin domain-containing protein [Polymorphospora rubra]|uniref:hemerythrin domain-containing protein n=1 Tax=Polymorphospora rubra TaxID=338584 RepID=UPI0033E3640D